MQRPMRAARYRQVPAAGPHFPQPVVCDRVAQAEVGDLVPRDGPQVQVASRDDVDGPGMGQLVRPARAQVVPGVDPHWYPRPLGGREHLRVTWGLRLDAVAERDDGDAARPQSVASAPAPPARQADHSGSGPPMPAPDAGPAPRRRPRGC